MKNHKINYKIFFILFILIYCVFFPVKGQEFQSRDSDINDLNSILDISTTGKINQQNLPLSGTRITSINENEYVVDAGDVFIIKVDVKGPALKIYNSVVTPGGYVIIPDAPTVFVQHLKLTNAKNKINKTLKESFPNAVVESYLYSIHVIEVKVLGAVSQPQTITLFSNNRLWDAVSAAFNNSQFDTTNILKQNTVSLRNVEVRNRDKKHKFDLLKYKTQGDLSQNPYLNNSDLIYIPFRDSTAYSICVKGAVSNPIDFVFQKGDKLIAALDFAGKMLPTADSSRIELLRFVSQGSEIKKIMLTFPDDSNFILKPDDRIYVRSKYDYHYKYAVNIEGAVKYPGDYPINEGKTKLSEVISAAGGFTPRASLRNAKLLREKNVLEDKELSRLRRMTVEEMNDIEISYFRLRSRENTHLVSCDFEKLFFQNNLDEDVVLRDGDIIEVPEVTKTTFVSGGVVSPGHITLVSGRNYIEYIELAGGFNERARTGSIKIIKNKSGVWLDAEEEIIIEEGDIIFVPESEEINWYDVFKEGLTILTQVGTIVLIVLNLK
jgi:protein involved in polysaccharide export with SLBB domain